MPKPPSPKQIERLRAAIEKRNRAAFESALMAQGKAAAAAVAEGASVAAAVSQAGVQTAMFDLYGDAFEVFAEAAWAPIAETDWVRVKLRGAGYEPDARRDLWIERATVYAETVGAEMVRNVTEATAELIRTYVAAGLEDGAGPRDVARLIRKEWEEVSQARAERIVRTETMRASNRASKEAASVLSEAAGITIEKEWIATVGPRTRDTHAALDGVRVAMNETFDVGGNPADVPGDASLPPEESINCFPGDVRIGLASVRSGIRSHYQGPIVRVRTASGGKLAGTPNHPVLTLSGWKRLDALDEGDKLIRYGLPEGAPDAGFDVDDGEACAEQVFDALARVEGGVGIRGVRVDLYGRAPNGDVNVVRADGFLGDGIVPALAEPLRDLGLALADLGQGSLLGDGLRDGSAPKKFGRLRPDGGVSGGGVGAALGRGHAGHAEEVGVSDAANLDAGVNEASAHGAPAGVVPPRDGQLGLPAGVCADKVVEVVVETTEPVGHVYTFATDEGMYTANGFIVSNCRCTVAFVPVETKSAPRGRPWRIARDADIKAAYPDLRNAHGASVALDRLAERHSVSVDTVRRAIGQK